MHLFYLNYLIEIFNNVFLSSLMPSLEDFECSVNVLNPLGSPQIPMIILSSGRTDGIKGLCFLKQPAITVLFEYYLRFPFLSCHVFSLPITYQLHYLFLQVSTSNLELFFFFFYFFLKYGNQLIQFVGTAYKVRTHKF